METAEKDKTNIRYHHVRVPMVTQMEYVECGAASLCMILAYYGKYVPLEKVRKDCNVSRDGSKASLILTAAEQYGLKADGYRYSVESCMTKVHYPAIIHWNMSHFVVLRGFGKGKAYLNDPALGEITVSMDVFDKSFTGIVLEFSPTDEFVRDGIRPGVWNVVKDFLKGEKKGIAYVLLTALVVSMIGVLVPAFQKVYIDEILDDYQVWKEAFFVIIFILGFAELTADTLNQIYSYRIRGMFGIHLNMSFFRHLLKLPMDFFMQRSPGEIIGRLALNSTVTQTMFDKVAPVAVQLLMAVIYFLVMLRSNVLLAFISLLLIVTNILVTRIASDYTVRYMQQRMSSSMQMDAVMVSGIDMIETIKSSGVAAGYFSRWASWQASVNMGKTRENTTLSKLNGFSLMIRDLTSAIILTFCAYLIMNGYITTGVLLAFQTLVVKLAEPTQNIADTLKNVKELSTSVAKIEDVMHYEQETLFKEENIPEDTEVSLLTGDVELKDITFGYSRAVPPLFENLNLKIKAGESVAFVGSSGSGKSTIARLLTGLLRIWDGEVCYDGKPIADICAPVFYGSVAMVSQDSIIYNDSIRNNISMWDRTVGDGDIKASAEAAAINVDVHNMPRGYDHVVASGGSDLSGGQRQRIAIARALAKNPTVLILDEATSALDAMTEHHVIEEIKKRKITTVIVAHRLSTVRSCNRIIVLKNGHIAEEGTHDELIARKGEYYRLVSQA